MVFKKNLIFVLIFCFIGLLLFFYKLEKVPPCLNADEAAFAYNSYSILKTGKDEFGNFLPLRLTSFGDYKMPLLSYLNTPFIALFGLNDIKIKYVNGLLLCFLIITIYLLTKKIFSSINIALLSSFLISTNWAIISMARQLHEGLLSVFLITLSCLLFIKACEKEKKYFLILYFSVFFISLFAYQTNRIFGLFLILFSLFYFLKRKISIKIFLISLVLFISFLWTDFLYKPERVKNLFFVNNIGFSLKINQLIGEGGNRLFYNKLTMGLKEFVFNYLNYFSPDFLIKKGDTNHRFGFEGISIIGLTEFLFFLVGLYYLFKNKEKYRFLIGGLLLISPIPAALSWAGTSLTRSLFLINSILILSSYGFINLVTNSKDKLIKRSIIFLSILSFLFFSFYTWDFYFNHYPKRFEAKEAWQCGYKELTSYVKNNYNKFDKFYITKTSGPPYIFLAFYLKYDPKKIQKQTYLGKVDQYGFRQVEKFDKFDFSLLVKKNEANYVLIGRPYEISEEQTKKININGIDVFWIREVIK